MPEVIPHPADADDSERWRDVAQLREDHPGWVIIWLARTRQYRAYSLSGNRRVGPLTAATTADLAAQIGQARPSPRYRPRGPSRTRASG
jgi:hypothetical protein